MEEHDEKTDPYLIQLVLSFQAAAMQQMGKVISPLTGKVERDLVLARNYIDMLAMMETKTKGNLTSDEQRLLTRVLYELRLNYVDESRKETVAGADEKTTPAPEDSGKENSADDHSADSGGKS